MTVQKYVYTVVNKKGKKEKDTIEASSIQEAKQLVKMNGKTLVSIEEATIFNSDISLPKKVKQTDLAIFCQQMKSMLAAGVNPVDAISMASLSTSNKTLKNALNMVVTKINKGDSMSTAFKQYADIFPYIMISMLEAGEESGSTEEIFDRLGTQFEKGAKLKQTIKKATSYPKMLILVMIAVFIVMCTFILPKFQEVFASFGAELPPVTVVVINISKFVRSNGIIVGIIIAVILVIAKIYLSTEVGKLQIDKLKLKIPVLKDLEMNTSSANMARILSTLLASGMYLPQALEIVSNTMTNKVYHNAMTDIKNDVIAGIPLTEAMENTDMFPPLLLNLLGIGEKTGDMNKMLVKAANYFEDEVDTVTEQLTSMLQPAVILILGLMVGILVYSIYGPMITMYDGLK